jgi:hypothetical protein
MPTLKYGCNRAPLERERHMARPKREGEIDRHFKERQAAMVAKKGIKMHIHFFEYIIFAKKKKKNYSPS